MSEKESITEGNWFVDLLMALAPSSPTVTGSPEEMTSSAAWKAFGVSTVAAIPPGPLGWATILPEVVSVTKIQINLIYSIAAYYKKEATVNQTLVMLVFANEAGIEVGQSVVHKYGSKLIVKALTSKALRPILQKIGSKIGQRITAKLIGRWIPFVLAPLFGAFSKAMTTRIGEEAQRLFSEEFEVSSAKTCENGHEADADAKYCGECGFAF